MNSCLLWLSNDSPPPLRGIALQLAVGVDGDRVAHQFEQGDIEDAVAVGEALAKVYVQVIFRQEFGEESYFVLAEAGLDGPPGVSPLLYL